MASVALLEERIRHRSILLWEAFAYSNRHVAKVLRWHVFKMHRAAMTNLCIRITCGDETTIVAVGVATFNHSMHGSRPAPRVSVLTRLRTMCRVYMVDAYLTSQLCAACHRRMQNPQTGTPRRVELD